KVTHSFPPAPHPRRTAFLLPRPGRVSETVDSLTCKAATTATGEGRVTAKQRLQRAEFLTNWFLEVFKSRKAPFPRRCFKGIAHHMEALLASDGPYKAKYKKK